MKNFSSFILKYIITLFNLEIQQAKSIRENNENKYIRDIQTEMNKIKNDVENSKNERYIMYYIINRMKFEEKIFETLANTIQRIQNSINS